MHIVLIDDHQLFSDGLKVVLEQQEDIQLVQTFDGSDIEPIHRYIHLNNPDVVLLDIHLGPFDGIQLGGYLMNRAPQIKLIFLTGNDYPEYRRLAAGIGAKGFLSKSMNPHELADNIRKVARGKELNISNSPTRKILSDDELETLQLVCTGASTKTIAEKLKITDRAVEYRLERIKDKLEVQSTHEAIIKGVKLGFIRMHN